jgi:hypothetical protein
LKNGSSHVKVKINEIGNGNANENAKDGEKSTENDGNFSGLVPPPGWEYAQEELMMKNNSQILSFQGSKISDGHRYNRYNNNNENENGINLKNDVKHYSDNKSNNNKGENIQVTVTENEKRFISVNGDSMLLDTVSVSSPDRNRTWTGTKSPPKISDSPGIYFDRNKNTSLIIERGSDLRNRHNLLQFESLNKLKNKNREIINMDNIPNRIKTNIESSDWNQKISFDDGNGRNSVYSGTNSLNLSLSNNGSHAPLGTSTSTSTPRIMLVRPKLSQSSSKDKDDININDKDDIIDDINDEKREIKDRKNYNLDDVYTDLEHNTNGDITERKKAVKNMVDNHIGDYMSTIQRDSRRDWEIIERTNGGRTRTAIDTGTGRNGVFYAKDKNIVENGSDSRGVNSRILMTSNKTLNLNEKLPGELDQSRKARISLQHISSNMKIEGGNIDSGENADINNDLKIGDANIDTGNIVNIEKNKEDDLTGSASNYNNQKNNINDNDTDNDSNNDDKSDDNDTNDISDHKNHNNGNKIFVSNYDNSNIKKYSPKNNNNNSNNNYDNNVNINTNKNSDITNKNNVKMKNKDDSIDKVQVPTFEKEALALQLELAQMQKALQDRMHRYQVLTSFNPEKSVN